MSRNLLNQPLVSVITPVYNGEKTIEASISSVLNQSYVNLELIVINDGSTDNTETILKKLSNRDFRIRIITQDNKGVSNARNSGLSIMQGKYFCFVDADDICPIKSIEHRLQIFINKDNVDFVDGYVQFINMVNGEVIKTFRPNLKGNPWKDLALLKGQSFSAPTWLIKRNNKSIYKFDENLTHGEDLTFFMQIADQGNYDYCNEVVLNYNQNEGSAMSNLDGLGNFYLHHLKTIKENYLPNKVSSKEYDLLKKHIRKIMLKSHLKRNNWKKTLMWLTLNLNKN